MDTDGFSELVRWHVAVLAGKSSTSFVEVIDGTGSSNEPDLVRALEYMASKGLVVTKLHLRGLARLVKATKKCPSGRWHTALEIVMDYSVATTVGDRDVRKLEFDSPVTQFVLQQIVSRRLRKSLDK